jgi:hypothetical protein
MAVPSSGPIAWSVIQATIGSGPASMSWFASYSQLGYSASNYWGYQGTPVVICYIYVTYDYGYVDYMECNGSPNYSFFYPYSYICAQEVYFGPASNSGQTCI